MNIVERAKKIILQPKNEWIVIQEENSDVSQIVISYLLPLALIPAVASFIGYGFIGIDLPLVGHVQSVSWGIKQAAVSLITTVGGALLTAFIIDALAPNFGAVKNFNKAVQLVVYAYTPAMVAGILLILPSLSIIAALAGIYGLYLLYLGIVPLMKAPQDKATGYFIVSLIVTILVFAILSSVLGTIIIGNIFY